MSPTSSPSPVCRLPGQSFALRFLLHGLLEGRATAQLDPPPPHPPTPTAPHSLHPFPRSTFFFSFLFFFLSFFPLFSLHLRNKQSNKQITRGIVYAVGKKGKYFCSILHLCQRHSGYFEEGSWLKVFNAELSSNGYQRGPRSRGSGVWVWVWVGETRHNATLITTRITLP